MPTTTQNPKPARPQQGETRNTQPETQNLTDRLPPHPSHKIDRTQAFHFTFNGKTYSAFAGDTIAGALWAAGVNVPGRSFKYHRPRAPFAFTGGDANGLVRAGDEPNVRPAVRPVEPGMEVRSQNAWPSLQADIMALTGLGSPFLPVGFYYKTFIRPKALWPAYETVLRHAAGLGHVTPHPPDARYDKQYRFADVLVIGAGPAGMSAALQAAEAGARVLLLDENPFPGGHLAYERQPTPLDGESVPPYRLAERLAAQVTAQPNIRFEPNTTAFGIYPHLWVGASQNDRRLFKIRARSLVIANGAFEQPLLFHNSDRPGVVLGSAAQRLMHLYAVKPGRRAVVLSANRDGLAVALDLHAAGVHVAAVVELRPHPNPDLSAQLREAGIPLHTDRIIAEARGSRELTGVMLAEADTVSRDVPGGIRPKRGTLRFVPCDLLAVSIGWTPATGLLYQAKAKLAYNEARREFLPVQFPPHVFAAGRVNGTHTLQAELLEGEIAGRGAAAAAGFGDGPGPQQQDDVAARKAEEPVRTAGVIYIPGGKKQFISFDEDVSVQDLRDSIAEGYNSMELLKRYSTLSMGPSQGKYESANTMALCAEANDQPISEVGTTTSRPPFTAVPLGVLAGRKMEPVKYTPMHGWHAARGAKMMNAGLWKRPEHYGDPIAEVRATRHSLGLIDVSTLGKIQLRGADVPKLLERLYTNRWLKLAEGRARYGVMLNEEGVVFNDGVTAHLKGDNWYMTTTTGGAAAVYEMITWYLQSGWNFDVRLCDLADTFAAINLTGPVARRTLQPLTDVDLRNDAFPYMGAREGTVAGVPATILRIGFTGELGYEMHVPAGYALYLWETLLEAGREAGITPFGVEAQRVMRLEKGHFIVGQDTDALTNPFMAHLDWAVKMEKDDFWGKPSLARVQKRGLHQRLVGYKMRHPEIVPEEANQIVRPNPEWPIGLEILGRVTSARYSPTLNESIGLCWLPVDMARPGVEFTVRVRGELHPGVVVPTPFYDPEGKRLRS